MTDIRTQKTQELITNIFIDLLKEKPMNKISVAEITRKANIGRGTFYIHYKDTYDLYDQLISKIINDLTELFDENYPDTQDSPNFQALSNSLISYISTHKTVFQLLIRDTHGRDIINSIKDIFIKKIMIEEQGDEKDTRYRAFVSFSVSGIIGVLTDWLNGKFILTDQEVSTIINDIIKTIF
ncbi:TetR/AcrR family transcriptional regulator [Companilactobacillus halodurans]|uniref:TetR/AcrR family transcriptional regulator n=1 Tax=Companilactobacillus halodurans TaxID=2584183 RepID=A0A5P0ZX25_9LACO|nr:TetR/AcrR family transcriptional regulator [Companilactobacillus halodurans]MQS76222.1 TetR/AcrR family transcriptional regulator [Companilactobacillus halodurans]MQS97362.1 TetR/AcrR family transcriptional regulator [Companilactobacillus halodurans]